MINNVTLVGRLTKDPDLRYTGNGTAVVSFTLAVNRNFKNNNGQQEADFINCVMWRKPAETLANHVAKGQQIGIVGRIQTRSYENQQGNKVYVTEVVADQFSFLEKKNDGMNQSSSGQNKSNNQTNFDQSSDPFRGGNSIDISDDDTPF